MTLQRFDFQCRCRQPLQATILPRRGQPAELRFFMPVRARAGATSYREVQACPRCKQDFAGVTAERLKDELGRNF